MNLKKKLLAILLGLVLFTAVCLTTVIVGQSVHVGESKLNTGNLNIIYVRSGRIHTEFILPVKSKWMSWNQFVPIESVYQKAGREKVRYVSIGRGDREFYFEMPTWDELKWDVIFKSLFLPTKTAIHLEYHQKLPHSYLKIYPLQLTDKEMQTLLTYIRESFELDKNGRPIPIQDYSYFQTDRFFKGRGRFHLLNTCNSWTVEGLSRINARRPLWSPMKYGVEWALKSRN